MVLFWLFFSFFLFIEVLAGFFLFFPLIGGFFFPVFF